MKANKKPTCFSYLSILLISAVCLCSARFAVAEQNGPSSEDAVSHAVSALGSELYAAFVDDAPGVKSVTRHSFALIGKPKYPDDFDHFDYVNPQAPKGGMIRFAVVGNYDNFNRYSSRGAPEQRSGELYDTLFAASQDEPGSYYPLIAQSVTYTTDYRSIKVHINPRARFQDGVPITAADIEFTFNKMMSEGVSQYRAYNAGVQVKALDRYTAEVILPDPNREKLFDFVAGFRVLPQHFWQDRDFSEPITTPPVGSSAYLISDYKLGQYAVYKRDPNYWAANLPVNKGSYNFDSMRYDYYLDDSIALEAFKAGEYDFREESQPKNWFTQYQGELFNQGVIIKQTRPNQTAIDTRWLAFNLARPQFNDRRVRQALSLSFDFAWLNRAFYYNSYKQPVSFFENTPYAAKGLPSADERALLAPYQAIIPPTIYQAPYQIPASDGSGFNRTNLLTAAALLHEAGWVLNNGQLVNQTTGHPFEFELLAYMGSDSKYMIPWQKNLAQLGIKMTINSVDYAQINRRLRERDYDMMASRYLGFDYPTSQLIILWGSDYLSSSWNASGLHNAAIDGLINQVANHMEDEQQLTTLGRALDRLLTHEYAMIPMWYAADSYYAYWNKFSRPEHAPKYTIGLNSWWYDSKLAAQLPKNKE